MKPVQLSYSLQTGAQCVKICVHLTFLMAGWRQMKTGERAHVCVTCACGWACIPKLCSVFLFYFFHPTRQYDLISADIFFLKRPFISHPAPPLNTFLIAPIDCWAPAMKSHNRLTYGLMFDWLSIWQQTLQPHVSLSVFQRVKHTDVSQYKLFLLFFFNTFKKTSWC